METVAARCPGLMKRVRGRPQGSRASLEIRMADESFRGEKGFSEQIFGADEQVQDGGQSD